MHRWQQFFRRSAAPPALAIARRTDPVIQAVGSTLIESVQVGKAAIRTTSDVFGVEAARSTTTKTAAAIAEKTAVPYAKLYVSSAEQGGSRSKDETTPVDQAGRVYVRSGETQLSTPPPLAVLPQKTAPQKKSAPMEKEKKTLIRTGDNNNGDGVAAHVITKNLRR